MSTVSSSKHGHQEKGTEVPREKLVRTLKTYRKLSSTQELEGSSVPAIAFERCGSGTAPARSARGKFPEFGINL